jgi:hypothetical protein
MNRHVVGILAVTLALTACDRGGGSGSASSSSFTATACGTYTGRGCAPIGKRIDLRRPSFSDSTRITNPLFPISRLRSALFLGHVDGKLFRTETTLLPGTRVIDWAGQRVAVRVSQYMAYLDGRLEEVALDRYAQADDGSVWYLGEDVFDYRDGTVAMTEGTWLAGREGPPAMIMPADPKIGDVYRTENAAPVVFEEVRITSVGQTVDGPVGGVHGAIVARELHSDGTHEDKSFAPGYGEFRTAAGGDLEAMALAVPVNAVAAPVPPELRSLSTSAIGILEQARLGDWEAASATLERIRRTWDDLRGRRLPRMVGARLGEDVPGLARAVTARKLRRIGEKAVDVAQSALDLELRHRPPAEIDAERFRIWTQQLRVDADAHDLAGVTGDVAVLEWIRDRFAHALDPAARRALDQGLRELRFAADARNLPAAADRAARLSAQLHGFAVPSS